jgi:hypothetical protein
VLTGLDCQEKPTMFMLDIRSSARMPGALVLPANQEK